MEHFIGYHKEHEAALYIRKVLFAKQPIRKATLHLSALGIVKGYCNGEEIENDLLTPGWTDYAKRIPYYTYDVTDFINEGKNVLAFTLGNGWAVGKIAWFGRKIYSNQPLMWCDLRIEYKDGTVEHIKSDDTFKMSYGQILSNDLFDGEVWDARLDLGNFADVDYDDGNWEAASIYNGYEERLEQAICPLTKKHECFEGAYMYESDEYQVYDFAQNHAGVPEIEILDAKAGTKLTFIYGEMLNEDGSIYIGNLRSAQATDVYICREGKQFFHPHMTFHGYRYLGVKIDGECQFAQIKSRMIYSDIDFYSDFVCSDKDINQLYKNVIASQKSNFINVPTDCPQRDERLGWTGDIQVFCRSAMFHSDCRDFYRKYLIDVLDAQLQNGMIDWGAPAPRVDIDKMFGAPAWGDVITVLPYEYYCVYKDPLFVKMALPAAKRWVHYCVDEGEKYGRQKRGYGDWLSINESTEKPLLCVLYMAYSALLTSKMCDIVGDDETGEYMVLYQQIRENIRAEHILPDGKLSSDSQTAYVLAYQFGIMTSEEIRPHLLASLHRNQNHLATGFIGVKHLLPTLCEIGEYDLAYEVFTKKDFPSWCYPVINGSTTMWERWNSYVIGEGFSDPRMNSFNHYAFGCVSEWMFGMVLGVNYTQEGVSIRPVIDESGKITYAKGSTAYGDSQITVEWKNCEDGWTELFVEKPEEVPLDLSGYSGVSILGNGRYLVKR